jgi:hypothetical protein
MKGFVLMAQFILQPSRTHAQYDLAALVSVPDIDETMTDALASIDKSMYTQVSLQENSQQLQVTIPRKFF